MRKHLESYHLTVEPDDQDFNNKEKCEKQLRRFIADKLSEFFPIICLERLSEDLIDEVGNPKIIFKNYKIDLDKVFGVEK